MRGQTSGLDATRWFAIGAHFGGAATLTLLSFLWLCLRPLFPVVTTGLAALGLVILTMLEATGQASRLAHLHRQVPRTVPADGGEGGQLQFGFEVGTGFRTHLTSALAPAVALVVALTSPTWWAVAAAALAFGSVRGFWPFIKVRAESEEEWQVWAARASRMASISGFLLLFGVMIAVLGGFWT